MQQGSNISDLSALVNQIRGAQNNPQEKVAAFEAVAMEERILEMDARREIQKLSLKKKNEQFQRLIDENSARKWLIKVLLCVTIIWMIVLIIFLNAQACGKIHLSDSVLITLIGTTTIQVLGFFQLVLKYLFNENKSS